MSTYSIELPQTQPDGTVAEARLTGDNLPALLQQARQNGNLPEAVRREAARRVPVRRIREAHRVAIFRQLADSLKAGMPLPESLRLIAHETHDSLSKNAVRKLLERIESGESFAHAAAGTPELFTDTEVALIEAGEHGSALEEAFSELADVSQSLYEMARRVGAAFVYPAILSLYALAVLAVMLTFAVPRFVAIFRDFKVTLPLPTQIILSIAHIAGPMLCLLLWGGIICLLVFLVFRRAWAGRLTFDFWKLRLPVMNHIFYRMAVARGCGVMSLLTRHGVPLMDALRLAGYSCGNATIQRGFEGVGVLVGNGETLARSLEGSEAFPDMLVWRVALAEAAGNVPDTFGQLSRYFSEQAESRMRLFTAILEPALVIIVGGAMGFIIISMFLPMMQIISSLAE